MLGGYPQGSTPLGGAYIHAPPSENVVTVTESTDASDIIGSVAAAVASLSTGAESGSIPSVSASVTEDVLEPAVATILLEGSSAAIGSILEPAVGAVFLDGPSAAIGTVFGESDADDLSSVLGGEDVVVFGPAHASDVDPIATVSAFAEGIDQSQADASISSNVAFLAWVLSLSQADDLASALSSMEGEGSMRGTIGLRPMFRGTISTQPVIRGLVGLKPKE